MSRKSANKKLCKLFYRNWEQIKLDVSSAKEVIYILGWYDNYDEYEHDFEYLVRHYTYYPVHNSRLASFKRIQ